MDPSIDITGEDWSQELFHPSVAGEGIFVVSRGTFLPTREPFGVNSTWTTTTLPRRPPTKLLVSNKYGLIFYLNGATVRAWKYNPTIETCLARVEAKMLDHALFEDKRDAVSIPGEEELRIELEAEEVKAGVNRMYLEEFEDDRHEDLILIETPGKLLAFKLERRGDAYAATIGGRHRNVKEEIVRGEVEVEDVGVIRTPIFTIPFPSPVLHTEISSPLDLVVALGEDGSAHVISPLPRGKNAATTPTKRTKIEIASSSAITSIRLLPSSSIVLVGTTTGELECHELSCSSNGMAKRRWSVTVNDVVIGPICTICVPTSRYFLLGIAPCEENQHAGGVVICETRDEHAPFSQPPVKSWTCRDPLSMPPPPRATEENVKRFEFFVSFVAAWECFILSCNRAGSIALLGTWESTPEAVGEGEDTYGWGRWSVRHNREDMLTPEVLDARTAWRLGERPDPTTVPVTVSSCALVMVASRPVPPFFVLGANKELEGRAPYHPPPTLLVESSDGMVEAVALVNGDDVSDDPDRPRITHDAKAVLPVRTAERVATRTTTKVETRPPNETMPPPPPPPSFTASHLPAPPMRTEIPAVPLFSSPPPVVSTSKSESLARPIASPFASSAPVSVSAAVPSTTSTAANESQEVARMRARLRELEAENARLLTDMRIAPSSTGKTIPPPPVFSSPLPLQSSSFASSTSTLPPPLKRRVGRELVVMAHDLTLELARAVGELEEEARAVENGSSLVTLDERWLAERKSYADNLGEYLRGNPALRNELEATRKTLTQLKSECFRTRWQVEEVAKLCKDGRNATSASSSSERSAWGTRVDALRKRGEALKAQLDAVRVAMDYEARLAESTRQAARLADSQQPYVAEKDELEGYVEAYRRTLRAAKELSALNERITLMSMKIDPVYSVISEVPRLEASPRAGREVEAARTTTPRGGGVVTSATKTGSASSSSSVRVTKETLYAACAKYAAANAGESHQSTVGGAGDVRDAGRETIEPDEGLKRLDESFASIALQARREEEAFRARLSESKFRIASVRARTAAKSSVSSTIMAHPLLNLLEKAANVPTTVSTGKSAASAALASVVPAPFHPPAPPPQVSISVKQTSPSPPKPQPASSSSNASTESGGGAPPPPPPPPTTSFPPVSITATTTTSPAEASQSSIDLAATITKYYQAVKPEKLASGPKFVEDLVEKYRAKPEELFQRLKKTYNRDVEIVHLPAGGAPSAFPAATQQTPKAPLTFASTPSAPTASPLGLQQQQQPPSFGTSSSSSSSSAFPSFGSHSVFGTSGGFGGPTSTPGAPAFGGGGMGFGNAGGANTTYNPQAQRERLAEFYRQFNPAHSADVDKTLAKYAGNESKLWRLLEQKYPASRDFIARTGGYGPEMAAGSTPSVGGGFGAFASAPATGFGSLASSASAQGSGGIGGGGGGGGGGFASFANQGGGGFGFAQTQPQQGMGAFGAPMGGIGGPLAQQSSPMAPMVPGSALFTRMRG